MSFLRHLREASHHQHTQNHVDPSGSANISSQHLSSSPLSNQPSSLRTEDPAPNYSSSSTNQRQFTQRRSSSSSIATYSSITSAPPPYSKTDPNQHQNPDELTSTNRNSIPSSSVEGRSSYGETFDQMQRSAARALNNVDESQNRTGLHQKKSKSKPKPTRVRRERLRVCNPMLHQLHKADKAQQAEQIREAKRAQAGEK